MKRKSSWLDEWFRTNVPTSQAPVVEWIRITPAEALDLLTLAARVDDRTPSEQATMDRLARALEKRA